MDRAGASNREDCAPITGSRTNALLAVDCGQTGDEGAATSFGSGIGALLGPVGFRTPHIIIRARPVREMDYAGNRRSAARRRT